MGKIGTCFISVVVICSTLQMSCARMDAADLDIGTMENFDRDRGVEDTFESKSDDSKGQVPPPAPGGPGSAPLPAARSVQRTLVVGVESGLRDYASAWVREFDGRDANSSPIADARIEIRLREDSAVALRDALRHRQVGLAFSWKPLLHRERRLGLRSIDVRRSALVPVVHAGNRVQRLGVARLGDVLTGREPTWSELNRSHAAIEIFGLGPRSTRQSIELPAKFRGHPLRVSRSFATDDAILAALSRSPAAIALVDSKILDRPAARGVRALSLDGIAPTDENLRTHRWPLTWTTRLITRVDDPSPAARAFASFVRSRTNRDQK